MTYYSIIRAKMYQNSQRYNYYQTYDRTMAIGTILTLVESGWYDVEERRILCRDDVIEKNLDDADIGSDTEWELLGRYFDMQPQTANLKRERNN